MMDQQTDKTQFLHRGFTWVENKGQNIRLIDRDNPSNAMSIKWDDLGALRELVTLALDDGPMVVGRDSSGKIERAKRDLAERVLAAIPEVGVTWDNEGYESWIAAPDYRDSVVLAIKRVFNDLGVEARATPQPGERGEVMGERQTFYRGDLSAPQALDGKGRCCGRKPLVYKRENHRFCDRCSRAYHRYQDFQISNWAWKQRPGGQFEYVTGKTRLALPLNDGDNHE